MTMNISDDEPNKFSSRVVSLSRSVVLTEESSIPSLLLLGKLVATDGAPDMALLRAELLESWAPRGAVNMWRVTHGAFLIQFYEKEDLTRVLDGAPWSCSGSNLFLVQHVKPDTNLVDQIGAGLSSAEVWVQFHNVPVEYVSTASVYKLAACVGEPVGIADLQGAAALRARVEVDITKPLVRSLPVNLDDQGCSRREMVSVVYEQIPSLCGSCGIIGHPTDRCPMAMAGRNQPGGPAAAPGLAASSSCRERLAASVWGRLGSRNSSSTREQQPAPATDKVVDDHSAFLPPETPAVALSRSLRDKSTAAGYVWSRLGSRSSSSREEAQPLRSVEQEDLHDRRSFGRSSSSAQLLPKSTGESSAAAHNQLLKSETPHPHPQMVSANRCLPCSNFLKLSSFRKKTALPAEVDLQASQKNPIHHAAPQTISGQPSVQESLVGSEETQSDTSLAPRRPSSIQIGGGYVNYYPYLGSRKNRKIEVIVETQCSQQIMKKAMEWLCENTGLKASYDGSRGVINIVGIQVDQRMGPLDLVAYLKPEARPKIGATYVQKKPDSPARYEHMLVRVLDERCCKAKGASTSKDTKRNTV